MALPRQEYAWGELNEAFISFAGLYGDRLCAFGGTARPKGFPYLTGREQAKMLLYRPRFHHPDRAAKPSNWAEAEDIAPGLNPISPIRQTFPSTSRRRRVKFSQLMIRGSSKSWLKDWANRRA